MDPLTAIGLVSNILSFIDFSTKLLQGAKEIHGSLSGTLEANRTSEVVVKQMKTFSSEFLTPDSSNLMGDDKELCSLATECRTLSDRLINLLEKVKPKDHKSKSQSLWSALKSKMHEDERRDIEQRLDYCRSQLMSQLISHTSRKTWERLDSLAADSKGDSVKLEQIQSKIDQLQQLSEDARIWIARWRILKSLEFEGMYGRFDMVDEAHSKTFRWILRSPSESDVESSVCSGEDNSTVISEGSEPQFSQSEDVDDDRKLSDLDKKSVHDGGRSAEPEVQAVSGGADPLSEHQLQQGGDTNEPDHGNDDKSDHYDHQSDAHGDQSTSVQDVQDHTSLGDEDQVSNEDQGGSRSQLPIDEDAARRRARELLINWLSSGNGIFHISGKLGSGKSTLMKFLCSNRRTKAELEKWAGEKTLVFASFFFWAPGSKRQKSLEGLYSALLHDILEFCPDMIPEVFPAYWKQALATPMQFQEPLRIPDSEIRKAFVKLTRSRHVRKTHCFCFFIDGLDEFSVTTQNDHKTIAELLCGWANDTPGLVKLCVSSREYNVFTNAFSAAARLRLHDLTRPDMENFVQDKLGHISDQESRRSFVDMILERAQGIFLWVTLVVKSIREQLENGATFHDLKEELETLPEELDGLFEYILQSIKNPIRKKAFLTLALLAESKKHRHAFSSLSYSFLDEFERDPNFAMADDFEQVHGHSMKRRERIELAEKKLIGRLKGLVELDVNSKLEYTHRSVPEFLQTRETQTDMIPIANHYNTAEVISQLSLAELRVEYFSTFDKETGMRIPSVDLQEKMARHMASLIRLRRASGLERPPYSFLDYLGSLFNPPLWDVIDQPDADYYLSIAAPPNVRFYLCATGYKGFQGVEKVILSPLYIMTFLGYHEYPVWKILNDQITTNTTSKIFLLALCCIDPGRSNSEFDGLTDISVLRVLLDCGLVSPNTKSHLCCGPVWGRRCISPEQDGQLTLWENCLLLFTLEYDIMSRNADDWHPQVFEAFLRNCPNLKLSIAVTERHGDQLLWLNRGETQAVFPLRWINATYEDLSPRQWIARSPLTDKESLLQLMDLQEKEVKLDIEEKGVVRSPREQHKGQMESLQEADPSTSTPSTLQLSRESVPNPSPGAEPASDQRFNYSRQPSSHIKFRTYLVVGFFLGALTAALIPFLWSRVLN